MGCGSSKTAVPLRPSEITMTFISRPISDDEKSVITNFFIEADDDQNGTISDEELGALLSRFIASDSGSVDRAVVHHVSMCLRGERDGKVKGTRATVDTALTTPLLDPSDRQPIDQETVIKWWPSILDFVNRYQHACQATFVPKYDFGFDTLILPFRDNGVGKVVVGDVPKLIDKITSACFEGECVFADSTFEPNEKALGKRDGTISWKRVRDLHPAPILYKDGSCAGDVICKGFGVNFYSAGISSLGQRFDLLVSAIYPPHYNPAGIYGVRLLLEETWVWLIVDDSVPIRAIATNNNKKDKKKKKRVSGGDVEPAFMMSAIEEEMWPLVIDKAFAKLKGSYTVLHRNRSLLLDPLALVVGCSPSIYTVVGINPVDRADEMWSVTKFYMDKRWFLTASPVVEDPSSGLVVEHAYSILGYISNEDDGDDRKQHPVVRLCRCRNPWGSGEWKGKWNDKDTASWDAYPTLKNKVKSTLVDDGTFWISIEDIASRFRNFHCHAVRPDIDRTSAEHSLKKSDNKEASKNPLSHDDDDEDGAEAGSFTVEPQAILGTLGGYPATATTASPSDNPLKRQPSAITMITDEAHDMKDNASRRSRSRDSSYDSSGPPSMLARMSSLKGSQHDFTRVEKLSPFTNMQWFTFRQCWQECYSELAEMEKTAKAFPIRETFNSVFEGLPQQRTNSNPSTALMSPFDCPQYLLEVPVGETCEFLFRAIRKLDLDQNGIDDDSDSDFDPMDVIRSTESNAADCPLPYTYLVRGKERLHVIPTRTVAEAFGGFAKIELKPGSYILFVMAYQRGDVPIKLVTKSKKALPITRLPPITTTATILSAPNPSPSSMRKNLVVIQGTLPAIGPQLDKLLDKQNRDDKSDNKEETNKVGKMFSTHIICTPPSHAMKVVYFALLVDHRFDYLDGSGSVAMGASRDPLQGSTFQWSDFRDHETTTTTVCSLAARGSGRAFSLYPFFTGPPRDTPIPYTLIAWGDDNSTCSGNGDGLQQQLTLTLAGAAPSPSS